MKGYGLPRNHDIAGPDCADIRTYGLKSAAGHLRGKGGDIRGTRKATKRAIRRIYKRLARADGKVTCYAD